MALRPVDRWEWLDLIRRARLGRTTKLVAVMLALYANEDGSRVFPGVARLTVVSEVGYNTVKRCLAELREQGWIEQVARVRQPGRSDEYRLTVDDGQDVPSPAEIDAEINRIRGMKNGVRPTRRAVQPDAQDDVRPTSRAVREGAEEDRTAHLATPTDPRTAHYTTDVRPTRWAATNHVPRPTTTPDHPTADLRTAVTVARAAEAATDSDFDVVADETPAGPPLPVRCEHNLVSRRRADGRPSCALCRVGASASVPGEHLARVIPLNRTQESA